MSSVGSIFQCLPEVPNCAPFSDPIENESTQKSTLALLLERINNLTHIEAENLPGFRATTTNSNDNNESEKSPPSEFEKSIPMLERILKSNNYDLEISYSKWLEWVTFRHTYKCDSITEDDIKNEMDLGLAKWRGKDKQGRPCLVITGRLLNADDQPNYKVTAKSFRKFLIKTVEDGVKLANQENMDQICVIYDRRGLEFRHIDPNLFRACSDLIEKLKQFYGDRVGLIYVLYTNWLFWTMYHVLIKPMLMILRSAHKIFVADTVDDLLEYFDDDKLLLVSLSGDEQPIEESTQFTNNDAVSSSDNNSIISSSSVSVTVPVTESIDINR